MKKRSKMIRVAVIVILLLVITVSGFCCYVADYYPAESCEAVTDTTEETDDYIVYGDRDSSRGFIFYPGAKIEETAYAPILDELAEKGICCVLVKMPYRLAVFDADAAGQILKDLPEIEEWYIGGHSLGGAMAAGFAADHEREFAGLILLAAYPTDALEELPVLSIYGSNDHVLNMEKYEKSIPLAKKLTEYVIEGGNHAGFGNYGAQKGDGTAEISEEEQWQETVDYILNFIKSGSGHAE